MVARGLDIRLYAVPAALALKAVSSWIVGNKNIERQTETRMQRSAIMAQNNRLSSHYALHPADQMGQRTGLTG